MKRFLLVLSVALSMSAFAGGAVVAPQSLSADALKLVRAQVEQAKAKQPAAFAGVQGLKAQVATLDKQKRGRLVALTPMLKGLGEGAEWALVDALVFSGELSAELPATAKTAWQVGLLEALGALRDVKVQPVLEAALATGSSVDTTRAAAEALAKLGNDAAVTTLLAFAPNAGPARDAVENALGHCRRTAVAQYLARVLVERPTVNTVRAMSTLASSWAWETPGALPVPAEAKAIRAAVVDALVKVFLNASPELKQQAADALVVVNAPEAQALLDNARAKDPAAVDALKARLAKYQGR